MKNLNKVFAMLLVVAMMMTSVVFADFSDVEADAAYAEAVNVGAALGLFNGYEDGTFKPEGDITRAEFAAIVVRAMNQDAQAASAANAASDFADVAEDHWAKGYINIVSKMGIVNGYGDGNFGPEDNVLFEQAVKMLVVALGYEPSIGTAGYPVGYLTKAADIGLTNNVVAANGVAANRGVVAQLVLNALDTPLMKQTGFGTWVDYVVYDGYNDTTRQTLLSENLGIVKLRVTVNESSATSQSGKFAEEYVKVDILNSYMSKYTAEEFTDANGFYVSNYQITVGDTELSNLVGGNAIVYAYYDPNSSDDPYAVYAAKDTTKTYEMTVAADMVESVVGENHTAANDANNDGDYDDVGDTLETNSGHIIFEYWENETDRKATAITIAEKPNVYVNGGIVVKAGATNGTPDAIREIRNCYGTITLQRLNTATTEDYDTIFIDNYKTIVVEENNTTRCRITAKNGMPTLSYDPDDNTIKATLYDENGEEMDWADLVEDDMISIKEYTNGNKTVIEATKISTTVTGAVTGIADEGTWDVEYTIGDGSYGIDPQTLNNNEIALGDEGTFYLDILGNITYYDTTATVNTSYAYVVQVGSNGNTLDPRTALKLYTFDGQFGTINTASKVKVDGVSGIDSQYVDDATIAVSKNAKETAKITAKQGAAHFVIDGTGAMTGIVGINAGDVITYSVNSSGYITAIDRAEGVTNVNNNKGKFTELTNAAGDFEYNENSGTLSTGSTKVTITDDTIIMVAPTLDANGNPLLDSNNQAITPSDLTEDDFTLFSTANIADEQKFKNARAFNVDNNKNVGFILVETEVDMVDAGAIMALVSGYGSANNAAGDPIYAIKVLQDGLVKDGKSEAALVTKEDNIYNIDAYDTIVPKYNSAGEVRGADILASVSGSTVTFTVPANVAGNKVQYYFGKVTERSNRSFTIDNVATATNVDGTHFNCGSIDVTGATNVYVYDSGASANNKVAIEDYSVLDYDKTTGNLYIGSDNTPCTVYAIAREYDGDMIDMVLYVIR